MNTQYNGAASVSLRGNRLEINWEGHTESHIIHKSTPKRQRILNNIHNRKKVSLLATKTTAHIPEENNPNRQRLVFGEEARAFVVLSALLARALPQDRFRPICKNKVVEGRNRDKWKHISIYKKMDGSVVSEVFTYYE
jgi:hypothetical protein